jgi:hypothetical protein
MSKNTGIEYRCRGKTEERKTKEMNRRGRLEHGNPYSRIILTYIKIKMVILHNT